MSCSDLCGQHLLYSMRLYSASRAGSLTGETALQAVGSAERRVWRAGATPFPGRVGSAGSSPGDAAPMPSRLAAASSREPTPMTESARRIAEALDSMTKVSSALYLLQSCVDCAWFERNPIAGAVGMLQDGTALPAEAGVPAFSYAAGLGGRQWAQ